MIVNARCWRPTCHPGIGTMCKMLKKFLQFYWFAYINLKADHKNQKIGLLWHPLSSILFIFAVGYVFANIQDREPTTHLAYVASGYTAWLFIASVVTMGSNLYKLNKSKILTGAHTAFGAVVIAQARTSILFVINHVALAATLSIIFITTAKTDISLNVIAMPIVYLLFLIASLNTIIITSVICVRFPDAQELISSGLRIIFLTTPIMWEKPYKKTFEIYDLNIFYHFVTIFRFCFSSEPFPIKSFLIASMFTTVLVFIGFVTHRISSPLISRSL